MGFLTDPSTKQVDPTPDSIKPLQKGIAEFLGGFIKDPSGKGNPFAALTSPLQTQAATGIGQFLGQNPEQQVFDQLLPGLMGIFQTDSASAVGEAAFPLFQRGLKFAQGELASSAPGRFSSAFTNQGIDLSQRALQDFNLLQQQAFQQNQQSQLAAGGLLGNLAQSAGQGAFGRNLAAGQFGLAQTQQAVNPILQLLLGGMNFAQPMAQDTVVGSSPLDVIGQIGATAVSAFGGGGGGG